MSADERQAEALERQAEALERQADLLEVQNGLLLSQLTALNALVAATQNGRHPEDIPSRRSFAKCVEGSCLDLREQVDLEGVGRAER